MAFDSSLQRKVMGQFATGVTIVTTAGPGQDSAGGLTANAVTSLSLDPPLLLVAVDRRSTSFPLIKENGCFAVNILARNQESLSRRFASSGPKSFDGLDVTTAVTGAPILPGTLGYADCRLYDVLPGGDHDIFVGEIVAGEARDGKPLLYFGGQYRDLAE